MNCPVFAIVCKSLLFFLKVNTALASGLAAALLTLSFARVSGAHINPAVTFAMMITRQLSPLRSILYICAQCGGGIAGAALVLGVYARVNDPALQTGGGAFGMEFVLTFMVVYAYCASRAENRAPVNIYQPPNPYATTPQTNYANLPGVKPDSLCIGIAYAACLVAWKGCLNPARALGAAFVSKLPNRFEQHWVSYPHLPLTNEQVDPTC
jgi:glycerol uptake facilitator-like aquaporin